MLFANIEFFAHETEVWYRTADSAFNRLEESDRDLIDALMSHIKTFYPTAYEALSKEYERCAPNRRYYAYRMALRFIRCNFPKLDNVPDVSAGRQFNFEYVECPLRGECKHENTICRPSFDTNLSAGELRVLHHWYNGLTIDEIAQELYLSPHTVNKHIQNAYKRLNFLGVKIREKADFVRFAEQNKLFS